ncbi:MAG: DUF2064 domain-containing protein [Nocardioides sp.]|nr:DUF2064 domain-containing protein [Nocardioides sp.]
MKILLVAKAPVPGQAKTRLGQHIGHDVAADVAAAALADTIETCNLSGAERHLALAGNLVDGERADELRDLLVGWDVTVQRGDGFAERLVNAHLDAGPGAVVQIGMDTPQVTVAALTAVVDGLADHDAVVGPAEDGGWWALGRTDPDVARALAGVPMSTPTTCQDTVAALRAAGHTVGEAGSLLDVDSLDDARRVAAEIPDSHFARAWGDR